MDVGMDSRGHRITVRLTDVEYIQILASGRSTSEYIRDLLSRVRVQGDRRALQEYVWLGKLEKQLRSGDISGSLATIMERRHNIIKEQGNDWQDCEGEEHQQDS